MKKEFKAMDNLNKNVWELNLDEIEFLYKYRHMNNYVYAALMTYHKSKFPLNIIMPIKAQDIK